MLIRNCLTSFKLALRAGGGPESPIPRSRPGSGTTLQFGLALFSRQLDVFFASTARLFLRFPFNPEEDKLNLEKPWFRMGELRRRGGVHAGEAKHQLRRAF